MFIYNIHKTLLEVIKKRCEVKNRLSVFLPCWAVHRWEEISTEATELNRLKNFFERVQLFLFLPSCFRMNGFITGRYQFTLKCMSRGKLQLESQILLDLFWQNSSFQSFDLVWKPDLSWMSSSPVCILSIMHAHWSRRPKALLTPPHSPAFSSSFLYSKIRNYDSGFCTSAGSREH